MNQSGPKKKKKSKRAPETDTVLGVPMRWEPTKIFDNYWNPDDSRIMPPKYFGIGWDINFHALLKKAGVFGKSPKS